MEKKSSFVLYVDYLARLEKMSMEQRGVLFTALLCYVSGEALPGMDDRTDMAFDFIRYQIDRDMAAYEKTVEKRREAGKKGGMASSNTKQNQAKVSKGKQCLANQADNVNVNDNVNDNNKKTLCKADADALFEKLWKLYPNKRGKGQVSDANKRRILDIGFDELARAIERYKADLATEDWRKPQNGSTFFRGGYIDYLDGNYVPPDPAKEKKPANKNRFTNYENQRTYDYDALEQALLTRKEGN